MLLRLLLLPVALAGGLLFHGVQGAFSEALPFCGRPTIFETALSLLRMSHEVPILRIGEPRGV